MRRTDLIPLEKRLQTVNVCRADFLAVFRLHLDTYFYSWDSLIGNTSFSDSCKQEIWQYVPLPVESYLLPEVVSFSGTLPAEEQLELLYHVLVEPFASWKEQKGKEV